ncbi:MAG: NDP-sugar synthase [Cyanobacteria bacterium REEB65]|nr:NDP-sugar synthase [Cyanobacteria bacterium REEB65]
MKAILIAGGEGTRLRPLTFRTPKPLLPLCGKPIIAYQIDLCRSHGIRDIVINLHYLADSLEEYLGDGSRLGVRLEYSREREPLGTAGAVKLAEPYFDGDAMLVFNGDVLTDLNLSRLLDFHRANDAIATLTTTEVADPTPFGLIVSDDRGRIIRFLEKPSREEAQQYGERFYINAGTYVLQPEVFSKIPAERSWSFERQVFPGLLEDGQRLFAFAGKTYWRDVGSPASYLAAHRDLLSGAIAHPEDWSPWPDAVAPRAYLAPGAEIPDGVSISGGPSFVSSGVQLQPGVHLEDHCVLGQGAILGGGVRLRGTIVGGGTEIGSSCEISSSIIGERCRVESDVKVQDGAILADMSILGRGTCLA